MSNWNDLKLADELREAINSSGWSSATQVQFASIPPMLQGRDVALQSRTGSGKTGAFVLPLLHRAVLWQHSSSAQNNTSSYASASASSSAAAQHHQHHQQKSSLSASSSVLLPPVFLVLVPSVELCQQTISVFEKLGKFVRPRVQLINLPSRQMNSASSSSAVQHHHTSSGFKNNNQNSSSSSSSIIAPIDIPTTSALTIVSTPAFLVKGIKNGSVPIDLISSISVLVIDEADMLTSHTSMQFLYGLLPPTRQSIVLSATLTENVARLKGSLLNQPIAVRVDEEAVLNKDDDDKDNNNKDNKDDDSNSEKKEKKDDETQQQHDEVRVVLPPEDRSRLKQYYLVSTDDCNRHTLLYSLFRFENLLLPGKTLIFVDDDKEPYRIQHFLEQLAVHSLVYDLSLPVKARCDILSRFQNAEKGVLICTDHTLHMAEQLQAELGKRTEGEQGEKDDDDDENENEKDENVFEVVEDGEENKNTINEDDDNNNNKTKKSSKAVIASNKNKNKNIKNKNNNNNNNKSHTAEPGLSRGIDFQNVTNVILFQGVKTISDEAFTNYLHRIGRTARAGEKGQAISFFSVPEAKQMTGPLRDFLRESRGDHLRPFKKLDRTNAAALQYRVQAAVQNVTRHAAKKLRVANVAAEMKRSSYLSTRLTEADTGVLKRLMQGATKKVSGDRNLRNVPDYMKLEQKADDTSTFEKRVNARSNAGGKSRVDNFRQMIKRGRQQDPLAEVASKLKVANAKKKRRVDSSS